MYDLFGDIENDPPARRQSFDLITSSISPTHSIEYTNTQSIYPTPCTPESTSSPLAMPVIHSEITPDAGRIRPETHAIRPRELFHDHPNTTHADDTKKSPPSSPKPSIVEQYKALFNYKHTYRNRYNQQDRKEAKLSETNLSKMICPLQKNLASFANITRISMVLESMLLEEICRR